MRLKGLAKFKKMANKLQDAVEKKMDDNPISVSTAKGEKIDNDLSDAWMIFDEIINSVKEIEEIKIGSMD
jgi:hypothetical protein